VSMYGPLVDAVGERQYSEHACDQIRPDLDHPTQTVVGGSDFFPKLGNLRAQPLNRVGETAVRFPDFFGELDDSQGHSILPLAWHLVRLLTPSPVSSVFVSPTRLMTGIEAVSSSGRPEGRPRGNVAARPRRRETAGVS